MQCAKCGAAISHETSFETGSKKLCMNCFLELAQSFKPLSSEDSKRLKKAVKEEMAGVLPRDAIKEYIEDGLQAILVKREDYDEVTNRVMNQIDRAAGLTMCQEVLSVIMALKKTLEEQETEIRSKIKRLGDLQ